MACGPPPTLGFMILSVSLWTRLSAPGEARASLNLPIILLKCALAFAYLAAVAGRCFSWHRSSRCLYNFLSPSDFSYFNVMGWLLWAVWAEHSWPPISSVVSLTEPGEDAILKQWWLQTKGEIRPLPPNLVVWWFLYKMVFSFLLLGRETYQVALNVLCSSRSWRPAQRTATIYASQGWNRWENVF